MVPNLLYAVYCAGDTESRSEGELRTQSQRETPFTHEAVLPTILGKLSLGSERACYHEKDLSSEPRTRSMKTPRKERNKVPDPAYKKGENVWLSVEGKYGSFDVSIDSDGAWDYEEDEWKYQVRQTDGRLYADGKLVGEHDLNRTQK